MKLTTLKSTLNTLKADTGISRIKESKDSKQRPEVSRKLVGRKRQAKRLEIYRRDGGKCKACGDVVDVDHFHLDHVHPIHLGGGDSDDNLQTLCIECHSIKTEQEIKNLYRK